MIAERTPLESRLEVIAGSMFSGKSEELIKRLVRHGIAQRKFQAFKPDIDVRFGEPDKIVSHSGSKLVATRIATHSSGDILTQVKEETEVVGIEEVQFFDADIVKVIDELVNRGKVVIVAGLPTDFRGEPFGSMPVLLAKAEKVDRLAAVCMVCGDDAFFTQRIVNGSPARYDDPVVAVGAAEMYEARCRKHHEVPGKPVIVFESK